MDAFPSSPPGPQNPSTARPFRGDAVRTAQRIGQVIMRDLDIDYISIGILEMKGVHIGALSMENVPGDFLIKDILTHEQPCVRNSSSAHLSDERDIQSGRDIHERDGALEGINEVVEHGKTNFTPETSDHGQAVRPRAGCLGGNADPRDAMLDHETCFADLEKPGERKEKRSCPPSRMERDYHQDAPVQLKRAKLENSQTPQKQSTSQNGERKRK